MANRKLIDRIPNWSIDTDGENMTIFFRLTGSSDYYKVNT